MCYFKKLILLVFILTSTAFAKIEPLFFKTYNFEKEDTLNIREKPNYHSQKIGELYLDRYIHVFKCLKIKTSKWCEVEALEFPEARGWVNAKYIKPTPYQEGYVMIKGQKNNCSYSLKCEEKNNKTKCLVVIGFKENNKSTLLETAWFNRELLTPANRFSAMPDDPEASGYCTDDHYIHDILGHKKF